MSNKFNLLYEHIISELKEIPESVDTFDYIFKQGKNDILTCEFETLNKNEELIKVIAYILSDGTIKFKLIDGDIKKTISEKAFMMKYYKDYEKFKESLKKYEEDSKDENYKDEIQPKEQSKLTNAKVPQIASFKSKLHKIVQDNDSDIIKANGITFEFQFIEDSDDRKLIQGSFELINDAPKDDELDKYLVIGVVKLLHENSVPIKFVMINPDEQEERFEIPKTDFKHEFPNYFEAFMDALNKFEAAND